MMGFGLGALTMGLISTLPVIAVVVLVAALNKSKG